MAGITTSAELPPVWEMTKENIQPVKVGRKVARLAVRQDPLEAERFEFTVFRRTNHIFRVHLETIQMSSSPEDNLKSWIKLSEFFLPI
jgi:hypothetical protein